MTKLTLEQLSKKKWKEAVIVFTEDSFNKPFTEVERSYEVNHDCPYFQSGMISNRLTGNCLDGTDDGVRLDWYLNEWKIDYCYITEA